MQQDGVMSVGTKVAQNGKVYREIWFVDKPAFSADQLLMQRWTYLLQAEQTSAFCVTFARFNTDSGSVINEGEEKNKSIDTKAQKQHITET